MSSVSKSVQFMRGCWQKKQYASVAEAMVNAARMSAPMLGAYRCKFCSTWHLGTWRPGFKAPLCHDAEDY